MPTLTRCYRQTTPNRNPSPPHHNTQTHTVTKKIQNEGMGKGRREMCGSPPIEEASGNDSGQKQNTDHTRVCLYREDRGKAGEWVPNCCGRDTFILCLDLDLLHGYILTLPLDLGFVDGSVSSLAQFFCLLVPGEGSSWAQPL